MTDFTNDIPTGETTVERIRRTAPRREYYAYFAIIFLAALPLSFLTWVLAAGRQLSLPAKGPIARAWSQAQIITPMIFQA